MSTLRGLRFCDKCHNSISRGEVHYKYGKKHVCGKCQKKKFPLNKSLVGCLFALIFSLGFARDDYTQSRIGLNTEAIETVDKRVDQANAAANQNMRTLSKWANSVEKRFIEFDSKYSEENVILRSLFEETKKQVQDVLKAQQDLVEDIKAGKITDRQSAAIMSNLVSKSKALETKLKFLMRSPEELVEKVIKPTVGVGVDDTKGQRLRGSAVLFKREVKTLPKGKKKYVYYGMTAYHVWHGIFKYQEKLRSGTLKDKNGRLIIEDAMKPKLVIYVYNGRTTGPEMIVPAKWVHPLVARPVITAQVDFAVFTFESYRKLNVAQLSTNAEISKARKYGRPIITAGISPAAAPALWTGAVANPKVRKQSGIMCHAYGYYGQSGGPTFDAKTLKVIGINQRINVHRSSPISKSPDTNVLFITCIDKYRVVFMSEVGEAYKGLLD